MRVLCETIRVVRAGRFVHGVDNGLVDMAGTDVYVYEEGQLNR